MLFRPLVCLLAAWTVAAADDTVRRINLKTHSIAPPYLDSELQSRWFDFGGDTIVRADKYIRLAGDLQSRSGWLFSKIPLTATNWEIEFEIKIQGKGTLHGDGMALWLTKNRAQPGPVFGHTDKFEGLGIFFDTYKNDRPGVVFPFVMAMLGDGQASYNKENDGKDQELASCSARGLRGASIPTKGRLTYYQDKSLKLELQYKSEDNWINCFDIGPVKLPSVYYLGFSAETGELSDNFDVINVQTSNLYTDPNEAPQAANSLPFQNNRAFTQTKKSSGWLWTFVKLVLFITVCIVGFVGWQTYNKAGQTGGPAAPGQKKRTRFD